MAKTFAGSETSFTYPGGSRVSASKTSDGSTQGTRVGAVFSFPNTTDGQVTSRVGISFISVSQACGNVNREISSGSDFQTYVQGTKEIWNADVLSKVTTSAVRIDCPWD